MMNELQKSSDCHDLTQSQSQRYIKVIYLLTSVEIWNISEPQTLVVWGQQTPFGRQPRVV